MSKKYFMAALLSIIALIFCFAHRRSNEPPGPFNWQRMKIQSDQSWGSYDSKVYDSVKTMHTVFTLESGDECYFLVGDKWVWQDSKDPAVQLVPVFCPKKGSGWAMPPSVP